MWVRGVALVGVLLLSSGLQQQAPRPADDATALRAQLRRLFEPDAFLPAEETARLIEAGLASKDVLALESALGALTMRPYFDAGERISRYSGTGWAAERPLLLPLKPRVRALVEAPEPHVRRAALTAFAALDHREGPMSFDLGDETIALLAERYRLESDVTVRDQAVRLIAFDGSAEAGRLVIVSALDDSHPAVIATAINGVEEHRMSDQLPRLAALLRHHSANVRLTAAGVMGTFGEAALPYLPDLRRAHAREKHRSAGDTMRGAISVLERLETKR